MGKFSATELGPGMFLVVNEENETNELRELLGCGECLSRRVPAVTSDAIYHGNNPIHTRHRIVHCDGRSRVEKNKRPCQEK